jgi:hypothetical protein
LFSPRLPLTFHPLRSFSQCTRPFARSKCDLGFLVCCRPICFLVCLRSPFVERQ